MSESDSPAAGIPQKDFAAFAPGIEPYALGLDSQAQEGVPRGTLTQHRWVSERIYPGTTRDYWVYQPAQYDPARPASLMVFQDGELYLGPDCNTTTVFDNLIHAGEMPITIGVFVNAGDIGPGMPIYGGSDNRSAEYDALGDRYARFLLEELLPDISARFAISADQASRAICGISSGGICAFTAAWERPDAFGKVIAHCGSFTNIRGGHAVAAMIRMHERKPLRIFLQSGAGDLDVIFGNWPIANRDVAAALAYRDYDHQFVFGEGRHSLKHGGAILPDTLRWLWRDHSERR